MSVVYAPDIISVSLGKNSAPTCIVWRNVRYRVTDTPTPLQDLLLGLPHPPRIEGWRFQGTDSDGNSRIFDIRPNRLHQEWDLLRVYD